MEIGLRTTRNLLGNLRGYDRVARFSQNDDAQEPDTTKRL